jgi:hypothetical protein
MAVTGNGLHGLHVLSHVGLGSKPGKEPVTTPLLLMVVKTAQKTATKRKLVMQISPAQVNSDDNTFVDV